jgi:hypothetical protein
LFTHIAASAAGFWYGDAIDDDAGKIVLLATPTRSSNDLPMAAYGTFCPLIRRQLDADEPVPIGLFVTH